MDCGAVGIGVRLLRPRPAIRCNSRANGRLFMSVRKTLGRSRWTFGTSPQNRLLQLRRNRLAHCSARQWSKSAKQLGRSTNWRLLEEEEKAFCRDPCDHEESPGSDCQNQQRSEVVNRLADGAVVGVAARGSEASYRRGTASTTLAKRCRHDVPVTRESAASAPTLESLP
jgi:hypothetical protein